MTYQCRSPVMFCLDILFQDKFLNSQRKKIIKQTEQHRHKNGNGNNNRGKSCCLPTSGPADMFHFASGFFDIFNYFHLGISNGIKKPRSGLWRNNTPTPKKVKSPEKLSDFVGNRYIRHNAIFARWHFWSCPAAHTRG